MSLASDARAIGWAGVKAADPRAAVRAALAVRGDRLWLGGRPFASRSAGRVHLLAVGKAAGAMVDAAVELLGGRAAGIAAVARGYPAPRADIETWYGDHPVPTRRSVEAGRRLLDYARRIPPSEPALFLISGGGSAIADVPAPGLSAADLEQAGAALVRSEAPIGPISCVRRHLSAFKGGQWAAATVAATAGTIALSDVVGDVPHVIASGPTVPDPTTFADALNVLARYGLGPRLPRRAVRHLAEGARGRRAETVKPGTSRIDRWPFVLGATNSTAVAAARAEATRRGYRAVAVDSPLDGETATAARWTARWVRAIAESRLVRGPWAVVAGGETTVRLPPSAGKGGRNQEFALAAGRELDGAPPLVIASLGTDGIDGPTDAAGGWADPRLVRDARRRGIDLDRALARHDAYPALRRLGRLWKTGPTGTNVMDLHVVVVAGDWRRRRRPGAHRSYGRK